MSFKTDGFLSPTMATYTATLRRITPYELWFKYAEELNRLGQEILEGHETSVGENQRLITTVLFIRANQSFQAAIILAERGMLADARTVLRSAVEGAIALNAIANDPTFDQKLIEAHLNFQRRTANVVLSEPDYRGQHSDAEIEQMRETVKDVEAQEVAAGYAFRDIGWSTVATKHCRDLYDLLYRPLSNDGTHTNVNAIHRFLEFDGSNPIGLRFGPSTHDLVEVLKMACLMFLWAAEPFARIHSENFQPAISAKVAEFQSLPSEEPADVSVVANYD